MPGQVILNNIGRRIANAQKLPRRNLDQIRAGQEFTEEVDVSNHVEQNNKTGATLRRSKRIRKRQENQAFPCSIISRRGCSHPTKVQFRYIELIIFIIMYVL